jgi:uncharacterized membrane protein YphA (DoxX/SURF4 family)
MKNILTLKNLGWVLTSLVSFVLIMFGTSKILGASESVSNFSAIHLLPYLSVVGILELLSVGLLIYPKTTKYGAILITSLMSAAAVIHLSYMGGVGVYLPVTIGVLSWVSYYLRSECRLQQTEATVKTNPHL